MFSASETPVTDLGKNPVGTLFSLGIATLDSLPACNANTTGKCARERQKRPAPKWRSALLSLVLVWLIQLSSDRRDRRRGRCRPGHGLRRRPSRPFGPGSNRGRRLADRPWVRREPWSAGRSPNRRQPFLWLRGWCNHHRRRRSCLRRRWNTRHRHHRRPGQPFWPVCTACSASVLNIPVPERTSGQQQ